MNTDPISRVERAIQEIRDGRMVIMVDDEDRENEGDLVMAADRVSPEAITFMATKGCGLICLTLTPRKVEELGLRMMVEENQAPLGTAFTVSIEAAAGVSTGISAADRAHTIRVAAGPASRRCDIISPGHVFPLRAMPGGVLQRTGQTEGSVDLVRLAGQNPAAVICEIMNADGTMARLPDLERFAAEHGLAIVSVADLVEYRLQFDRLVERVASAPIPLGPESARAQFTAHVYRASPGIERHEYLALTLGDVAGDGPTLVRGHSACLFGDVFGAPSGRNSVPLDRVIELIIKRGRGVILYLPPTESLATELETHLQARDGRTRHPHDPGVELREYGIGAQILMDLGVRRPRVISNTARRLVGLGAYRFESLEQATLEEA